MAISWDQFIGEIETEVIQAGTSYVEQLSEKALKLVQAKTPTDTENLIDHITVDKVRVEGRNIIGRVTVDDSAVPYAKYVEGGNGRSKNWHKKGKVFYQNSAGAQMFARTQIEIDQDMGH